MDTPSPTIGIQPYIDQAIRRIERYFAAPSSREALVIGVFGEWGSGKSFLLERVGERFPNEAAPLESTTDGRLSYPDQTLTIRFNPWRYEREVHLLVPLLKTTYKVLGDFVNKREQDRHALRDPARAVAANLKEVTEGKPWSWVKDRLVTLGNITVAASKMVEIKAGLPGLGEIKLDTYGALRAVQEQVDRADHKTARKNDSPLDCESLYYDLHNALHEVTRGKSGEDDSFRLNFLFLVDDIDRCLPDKAVEMLESIKLFLDVPGCTFMLALDDEVVERGIAHRYRDYLDVADRSSDSVAYALKPERYEQYLSRHAGCRLPPITGHEYLEKIVQLPFRLPRWSRDEVREFLRAQFPDLFSKTAAPDAKHESEKPRPGREGNTAPPRSERDWLVDLFVQAVPPVPRKLIRAAELLEFTRGVIEARGLKQRLDDYTLAQLVLLQLFAPQCFRFLRRERREAWLALERRIGQSRRGEGAKLADGGTEIPPGHTSASFFDWWQERCEAEKTELPTNATYLERVEIPFIAELRHAARNRSGFDPRALFLPDPELRVDEKLDPYFSLFEPAMSPSQQAAVARPQRPAISPSEPSTFVSLLLGTSRESWLNALSSESGLTGAVLDESTFELLLTALKGRQDLPNNDWLELVLPILNPIQIKRLYRDTNLLRFLASSADMDTSILHQGGGRA